MNEMTDEQKLDQLERLAEIKPRQWNQIYVDLAREVTGLLHGHFEIDDEGKVTMKGGFVYFGAHTEYELGCNPLGYYVSETIARLWECRSYWNPKRSLLDQLKRVAAHVVDDEESKYKTKMKTEEEQGYKSKPVSLDVEILGSFNRDFDEETEFNLPQDNGQELGTMNSRSVESTETQNCASEDMVTENEMATLIDEVLRDEAGIHVSMNKQEPWDEFERDWAKLRKAAEGDDELDYFLKAYEDGLDYDQMKEQRQITQAIRDKMIKRLQRRVNKKTNNNGKKENRQRARR